MPTPYDEETPTPLVILARGILRFDYPLNGNGLPLVNTDIIAQLRNIGDIKPVIMNLAHFGETSSNEMSLQKQERMIRILRNESNWMHNGKPDAILFSGGGNDIAGDQF